MTIRNRFSRRIAAGEDFSMSSERKTFLVWWAALLLFIAIAAYIKHNKARAIHEPQDNVTTVDPGVQNTSAKLKLIL
jgi:hypothetical protein